MAFFESRREYKGDRLRSTAYDRVASLILALLVLVGSIVLVLFGLWALPKEADEIVIVYQPELIDNKHDEERQFEFETPDAAELAGVPLLQTPALFHASIDEAIKQVTQIDMPSDSNPPETRPPGPDTPNDATIPPWERWEIQYSATSIEAYARQLDHFGIELGAAGGGRKSVDYASHFTKAEPIVRLAPGEDEPRLYMTWRDGLLKKMDQQLLQRAGITVRDRVVLQFYPAEIEASLAKLEATHADGRAIEEIRKTTFGARAKGDGYEYFIKAQTYR